jgi:zinc protease
MMLIEFKKLCDVDVPLEELDRAKRYLIGRGDIDLQRNNSVSGAVIFNSLYGLDINEAFKGAELYSAVDAAGIRRVAKKIFSGAQITAMVGPKE